jgi:hypothetical protein
MMFFRTIALLMLVALTATQKSLAHSSTVAQPEGLITQFLLKSTIADQAKIAIAKKTIITGALAEKIKEAARISEVSQREWIAVAGNNPTKKPSAHGRAPMGYTIGMALAYAEAYSKRTTDVYVIQMSRPVVKDKYESDCLYRLKDKFEAKGMTNTSTQDRLRNLFVTLYELGVRESDGRYYLGVDNGPNKPKGEIDDPTGLTTEAGLFQSSWNYSYQNPLLKQLFKEYRNGKRLGFLATIFAEGVLPADKNDASIGIDNDAIEFQKLVKSNPGFAIEFAGLTLRNIGYVRSSDSSKDSGANGYHFLKFLQMEISSEAESLFKNIENIVDRHRISN